GARAGALGLPPKATFRLAVVAGGALSEGRFGAVATSGASEALRALGDWNKAGGDARGWISLTASSLTAPHARRFGPRASFVVAGRRAGPELFALDARMASDNLALRAVGLGDVGQRRIGPGGLALT